MTRLLLAAATLALAAPLLDAAEAPAAVPVGINLAGIADWSTELPFVDVFKASRQFIPQKKGEPWGKGPMPERREDGYPKRLDPDCAVDTFVLMCGGHYEGGRWLCLYEGKGKLEFRDDAKAVSAEPGRIVLDLTPKSQVCIKIVETDPADPIHDIRIIPAAAEKTYLDQPFNEAFLARWRGFRVLRFMDWMSTNGSKVREWTDRPKTTDPTQSEKGVALEYMIALANALKADPWFCMPHLATDDYVRRFAEMVKARLAKDRKVYVEYSNETWNFMFPQTRYCLEQGKKLGLSDNDFQACLRYHSQRAVEIFRIWEDVFGGHDRLVRVLATQGANPWVSEQILSWKDAAKHADALAGADYFGHEFDDPKKADQTAALSVEELLDRCMACLEKTRETNARQVALARKHGVPYVAYEAGQHLVGVGGAENNQALMDLFVAANRHPKMKDVYLRSMNNWKDVGGGLYVIFSSMGRPSKWGSWGILEYEGQDPATAPKHQAVLEFIRQNPGP